MERKRQGDAKAQSNPSSNRSIDDRLTAACRHYFDEKIVFEKASRPDPYLQKLHSNYRPLNPTMPELTTSRSPGESAAASSSSSAGNSEAPKDGIPPPKRVLYDPEQLVMKWKGPRAVGAGLGNMGNTCFLNSVLQCLTYTPPLFNYLSTDHHRKTCRGQGFCALCELQKHVQRVSNQSGGVVKPVNIVQNLRVIGKHFRQGRQEDAHEFLRYFVDGLQKSSLQSVPSGLDPHSKATTVVHQIFGGYHCSQVRCSECVKTSETFDPLLDLSLDIKNCASLKQALNRFTKPDSLEGDNQYACPFCKKMTPAAKVFTLHRLPNILTIQLKRFDYNSLFGGKINKPVSYQIYLDMRPYTTSKKGPPQWYQLYAVLVHSGYSCRSGHYYCYVKGSNKIWYCLNDAQVTQVSEHQVLRQEAYLLFYARDPEHKAPPTVTTPPTTPLQKSSDTPTTPNKPQPPPTPPPPPPQPKVRPDPNFLGEPIKRPSPHLDKTGTLFVRVKPTGVVPPSPQGPSLVTSSSSSSSSSTPASAPSSTHSQPQPHPPALPLRKSDIDHTPKTLLPPIQVQPPKPVNPTVKKPSFIPRVIIAPSSLVLKKKKLLQQQSAMGAAKNEKKRETGSTICDDQGKVSGVEGEVDNPSMKTLVEKEGVGNGKCEEGGGERTEQVFIGPRLPSADTLPSVTTPSSSSSTSPSLKIARVTPQVKPGKPVALVHPVVPENTTSLGKSVVKIVKGLAGETLNSKTYHSSKPGWRPVGMTTTAEPSPTRPTEPPVVPPVEPAAKNDREQRLEKPQKRSLSPKETTKKPKKHKKKKSRRTDDEREQRERKHSRSSIEERGKRRSVVNYTSDTDSDLDSEEDERQRKKRSHQHTVHRERDSKHYTTSSAHSRSRHSTASFSSSSENSPPGDEDSDSERENRRKRSNRDRRRERKYSSSHHRDREDSQSKNDFERRKRYSSTSKYHSPSPDRRERKRNRSSFDEDEKQHGISGGSRHKSHRQDSTSHHHKKKHHTSSSSHHHHHHHKHSHHHERIKPSKHLNTESKYSSSSHGTGTPRSSDSKSHTHQQESKAHQLHEAVGGGHHIEKTLKPSERGGEKEVPEVVWDQSERKKGEQQGSRWDGSRKDDVISVLTSQASNELGKKVKSWDGGRNTVDASGAASGGGGGDRKRRDRDDWDHELDRGKVKKVKSKKEEEFPSKNPFQEFQNKKNATKSNNSATNS